MNKLFIILKKSLTMYLCLLIYLLIASIFYYFEILNYKVIYLISFIVILLIMFIFSFLSSKEIKYKGYINGFLYGLSNVLLMTIISKISSNISSRALIYYILLIVVSISGGILGIQKNLKN